MQRLQKSLKTVDFYLPKDDVILLCLASSTTPRRRNLLVALAQYTVTHFRSSSTKLSSWFLSSLQNAAKNVACAARARHERSIKT